MFPTISANRNSTSILRQTITIPQLVRSSLFPPSISFSSASLRPTPFGRARRPKIPFRTSSGATESRPTIRRPSHSAIRPSRLHSPARALGATKLFTQSTIRQASRCVQKGAQVRGGHSQGHPLEAIGLFTSGWGAADVTASGSLYEPSHRRAAVSPEGACSVAIPGVGYRPTSRSSR